MELSIFDLRINFIGTMFIVFVKKIKCYQWLYSDLLILFMFDNYN